MDVNLQSLEAKLDDYERPIFDVFKATLQYPIGPTPKAIRLADDITFFFTAREEGLSLGVLTWRVWFMLLDLVSRIPPGHPWQDSFLQALQVLRGRGATRIADDEPNYLWENLPDLNMAIRENFNIPSGNNPEEPTRWKNLNSFLARLEAYEDVAEPYNPDQQPGCTLPIWAIREGLEDPLSKGYEAECMVWVATEWIIHLPDTLFMEMHTKAEVSERMARLAATHELAKNIVPHSPERWAFWKKRLAELSAKAGEMEMDGSIVGRIAETLKAMESSQGRGPAGGQADSSLKMALPAEGKADLPQEGIKGTEEGRNVPAQVAEGPVEGEANPAQGLDNTVGEKADSTQGLEGTAEDKANTAEEVEDRDKIGS